MTFFLYINELADLYPDNLSEYTEAWLRAYWKNTKATDLAKKYFAYA